MRIVSPLNETVPTMAAAASRLAKLEGKTVALLDISKPGGSVFLDFLEERLRNRGVAQVMRVMKPTFAKPAPPDVLEKMRSVDAVIEALAD